MDLDFLEIGTCDFDCFCLDSNNDTKKGIIVEPLSCYLDNLPNKKNCIKVNKAISDKNGKIKIYYLPEDIIKKYNLPRWLKGCNKVNDYHPLVIKKLEEYNLEKSLVKIEEVDVITIKNLIETYNIKSVDYLKIDTEGHDLIILNEYINYCTNINKLLFPNKILFESNYLSDKKEVYRMIEKLKTLNYKLIYRNVDTLLEKVKDKVDNLSTSDSLYSNKILKHCTFFSTRKIENVKYLEKVKNIANIYDEERFIKAVEECPRLDSKRIITNFLRIVSPHAKSDFARYVLLYMYGGLYIDIDFDIDFDFDKHINNISSDLIFIIHGTTSPKLINGFLYSKNKYEDIFLHAIEKLCYKMENDVIKETNCTTFSGPLFLGNLVNELLFKKPNLSLFHQNMSNKKVCFLVLNYENSKDTFFMIDNTKLKCQIQLDRKQLGFISLKRFTTLYN